MMKQTMKRTGLYNAYPLLFDILALVLLIAQFLVFRNEFVVAGSVVVLAVLFLVLHRERGEITLFIIGVILGIVLEVGGDMIYKLQYWEHGSFFGIPYWLPLMWGYAFVFIRRIGNHIVKK